MHMPGESHYMRSLGKYRRPEIGEKIQIHYGAAEVLDVTGYDEAKKEMEGTSPPLSHMITTITPTASKIIASPPIKNGPVFCLRLR